MCHLVWRTFAPFGGYPRCMHRGQRRRPQLGQAAAGDAVARPTLMRLLAVAAVVVGIAFLAAAIFSWAQSPVENDDSRAADASVREPTGTFIADVEKNPAVVWAVGDGADGGDDAKALAERIAADKPDRF